MFRARTTPSNEELVAVPVFGVDPHGAAIFTGAVNGTVGRLGSRVVIDPNDAPWHGWTQQPQRFKGAGNLGANPGGRPVVDPVTNLDEARSSAALSPMQALMEQRAARGLY